MLSCAVCQQSLHKHWCETNDGRTCCVYMDTCTLCRRESCDMVGASCVSCYYWRWFGEPVNVTRVNDKPWTLYGTYAEPYAQARLLHATSSEKIISVVVKKLPNGTCADFSFVVSAATDDEIMTSARILSCSWTIPTHMLAQLIELVFEPIVELRPPGHIPLL